MAKRRRVRWDRILVTGLILFALIFMLYSCFSKDESGTDEPQNTTATQAETTQPVKKFTVTLTKADRETGTAQGDARLAEAVYGLYKDGELVDSEDDDYIDGPEEEDGYIDDDYSEKDN